MLAGGLAELHRKGWAFRAMVDMNMVDMNIATWLT
jgi:hypothetical protein